MAEIDGRLCKNLVYVNFRTDKSGKNVLPEEDVAAAAVKFRSVSMVCVLVWI